MVTHWMSCWLFVFIFYITKSRWTKSRHSGVVSSPTSGSGNYNVTVTWLRLDCCMTSMQLPDIKWESHGICKESHSGCVTAITSAADIREWKAQQQTDYQQQSLISRYILQSSQLTGFQALNDISKNLICVTVSCIFIIYCTLISAPAVYTLP